MDSGVQCLSDIPSRSETTVRLYDNTAEKPGIIYSADAQCSLFFGGTTKSCVKKTVSCENQNKILELDLFHTSKSWKKEISKADINLVTLINDCFLPRWNNM